MAAIYNGGTGKVCKIQLSSVVVIWMGVAYSETLTSRYNEEP